MDKNEFLEQLRSKLLEELSVAETAYHVQYYDDYINSELAKGCTETSILESLGSPEIVAKNLLDNPESRTHYDNIREEDVTPNSPENHERSGNFSTADFKENDFSPVPDENSRDMKTGIIIVAVVAIIAILAIAVLLFVFAFKLAKLLLPIVLVIAVIALIIRLLRK